MKCKNCKIEFEVIDSIGSNYWLCQDCWEKYCTDEFWHIHNCLDLPELTSQQIEHMIRIEHPRTSTLFMIFDDDVPVMEELVKLNLFEQMTSERYKTISTEGVLFSHGLCKAIIHIPYRRQGRVTGYIQKGDPVEGYYNLTEYGIFVISHIKMEVSAILQEHYDK